MTDASPFDLAQTDALLSTTRAVRKRLDLQRPVEPDVILDCIRLSQQAPTGGNGQGWRWIVVTNADKRRALGDIYRRAGADYLAARAAQAEGQLNRVLDSASYLAEHIQDVPVHVIPCSKGRPPEGTPVAALSGMFGSIYPAVWSFQLALRSRGLGSCLTTFHLAFESEVAELLDIPEDVTQIALLPVAYTKGTDFRAADRRPPEHITSWNSWGTKDPG